MHAVRNFLRAKTIRRRPFPSALRRRSFALCRERTHQGDGQPSPQEKTRMHTRNVNVKTAAQESTGRWVLSFPEPQTARLIAVHGTQVSYAWNVLEDLKAAGASYARRNILADMFRRLGVK